VQQRQVAEAEAKWVVSIVVVLEVKIEMNLLCAWIVADCHFEGHHEECW